MKILDCTLRDGGYYTNWDFDKNLVKIYCESMEALPVDYVEVGYRSIPMDGYLGEYYYCPEYIMKELKEMMPSKKLVIILNEKDIRSEHVMELLGPCKPFISMVRIAIDPVNLERSINLAKSVKEMGFEVAFNVMYMSTWKESSPFLNHLKELNGIVDYFYMVDSFGGVLQHNVTETIELVKSKADLPIGFHGHNNLEMALVNTITALDNGCGIVDATVTGMGRGAGNLKTELLLTYLASLGEKEVNFTALGSVVAVFEDLNKSYGWGTNLPYMFSGAYSLPQKQVMEWVGMNRYPISSIVNALNNSRNFIEDNFKLPVLKKGKTYTSALIIGGGNSVKMNTQSIHKFLELHENICLIHAGVKHVRDFLDTVATQYYILSGFDGEKLVKGLGDFKNLSSSCVFPAYPRKMGTIIPPEIHPNSVELTSIDFTKESSDSPLAIASQTALDLGVEKIYFAGFDGYNTQLDQNQFTLAKENQNIFNDLFDFSNVKAISLTHTKYKNLPTLSIHSFL